MTFDTKRIDGDGERAVTSVVGVLLLIAVTVILSAVVALFVLDIGVTSAAAQATYDISQDEDGDLTVTIAVTTADRLDSTDFASPDCDGDIDGSRFSDELAAVKNTTTGSFDGDDCEGGDTIQIISIYEGDGTIIQDFDLQDGDWDD